METNTQLEEQIAHLTRALEDLSDVVAQQDREITRLRLQLEHLIEREAERSMSEGGSVVIPDQKPPHW